MATGAFTVHVHDSGALTREIRQRAKTFVELEKKERAKAAKLATEESKKGFQRRYGKTAPPRPGRRSKGLVRSIEWKTTANGTVALDVAKLDRDAPHWIIQEIGTNQRATIKRGGSTNPRGAPRVGADYVKTVPSQVGRQITVGLAFGTSPSGTFQPPSRSRRRQDQLYYRGGLRNRGRFRNIAPITIGKEIEGQHFIQRGAATAFRSYRPSVRAAAQNAFGGRPRR